MSNDPLPDRGSATIAWCCQGGGEGCLVQPKIAVLSDPPSSSRRDAWIVAGLFAVAVLIVLGHELIEIGYENGISTSDSGIFATIGLGLAHGHLPYSSYWDHKLPGIYLVDAAIFKLLPANPWSLQVGETAVFLAMVAAFWFAVRQVASPLISAVGTALFAYLSTLPLLNQGGNLVESYWQLPEVIALGCFLRYLRGSAGGQRAGVRVPLLLAGVAAGVSTVFAPQALITFVLMAAFILIGQPSAEMAPRPQSRGNGLTGWLATRRWDHLGALILGWAVVTVPVLLFFALAAGISPFVEQVFTYNRAYASAVRLSDIQHFFIAYDTVWIPALFLWGAIVIWAALVFRSARSIMMLFLVTVFIGNSLGAMSDRHFYPHDVLFGIPAAVLLLSCLLQVTRSGWSSLSTAARSALALLAVVVIIAFVPSGTQDFGATMKDLSRLRVVSAPSIVAAPPIVQAERAYPILTLGGVTVAMTPTPAVGHQLAGEAIDRLVGPRGYLYMYSPEGGMYFVVDRPNASRFLYNTPLIGSFGSALTPAYDASTDRREMLSDIRAHQPAIIAVRAFRRAPRAIRAFPAFEYILCSRYRVKAHVQGFLLFVPDTRTAGQQAACFRRFAVGH